jgi:serine/threonine-protein kinase HipA
VPAQDLPTFWRALVFNWLIGNCDAHAKNFSLLYDGSAPTLAPLYDLVSTTAYPELTTRLAMSIDGATQIGDVNTTAWEALAKQTSYSTRFIRATTNFMIERTVEEAGRLAAQPWHDNSIARQFSRPSTRAELDKWHMRGERTRVQMMPSRFSSS